MGLTDAQRKAVAKYKKQNVKQISLNLNVKTDADIIEFLDILPKGEVSGFIKRSIRKNMPD